MFCQECGRQVDDQEMFCIYCGVRLEKEIRNYPRIIRQYKPRSFFDTFLGQKITLSVIGGLTVLLLLGGLHICIFRSLERLVVGTWVEWYENGEEDYGSQIVFEEDGTFYGEGVYGTYECSGSQMILRGKGERGFRKQGVFCNFSNDGNGVFVERLENPERRAKRYVRVDR